MRKWRSIKEDISLYCDVEEYVKYFFFQKICKIIPYLKFSCLIHSHLVYHYFIDLSRVCDLFEPKTWTTLNGVTRKVCNCFDMFRRYLVYAEIAIAGMTLFTLVWACLAVRRRGLVFALFFFDLVTTIIHFPI